MRKGTPKTGERRGAVKHIQQTRVADGEGREKSSARGKQQKIGEKKEANPRVERMRVQKKNASLRRSEIEAKD